MFFVPQSIRTHTRKDDDDDGEPDNPKYGPLMFKWLVDSVSNTMVLSIAIIFREITLLLSHVWVCVFLSHLEPI